MHPRIRQVLSLLLGLVIVGVLIWWVGHRAVLDALLAASPRYVVLGLLVYVLSWPIRVFRMRACLETLEQVFVWWSLFEINIAGYGLNIVFPAKLGDIARAVYLIGDGIPTSTAVATVAYVRIADLISVSLLAMLTVAFIDSTAFPSWLRQLVFGIAILVVLALTLPLLVRQLTRSTRLTAVTTAAYSRLESRLFRNALSTGESTGSAFNSLVFSPRMFGIGLTSSVLIWVLEALTAYAVGFAFGVHIPVLLVVFAVSIANLAKILPLTPGGLGIYEAAFTGVVTLYGFEASLVVTIALVEHNIKNLFNIVVGVPIATKRGTAVVTERWPE